ncbi:hypothetical protein PENTCL1PPCAC_24719, partial [Pristionchus entomophagus]
MARLRLLHAATLLLLMLQLLQTVEGQHLKLNYTGCTNTKACWVSEECARPRRDDHKITDFHLRKTEAEFVKGVDPDCDKYLIIEWVLPQFRRFQLGVFFRVCLSPFCTHRP